jgi:hypothetical protein
LRSTVGDFPDEADVEVITPRDDAIAVQLKDAIIFAAPISLPSARSNRSVVR